ncbi:hypothetical protein NQD34_004266 [Periophthalmus magnuspinnatus]|nr:hypothetical protein NQD34_004266 [Periophthalmus magnuspinnatus]
MLCFFQVESPACLWGRVVGTAVGDAQSMGQYNHMMAQMNLFYHDVTQDQHKLKVSSFEKEQICVVYWPTMKSWCRAKMKAVITDSVSSQARCFLVDYGEQLVVPTDQIRVAMPDFLLLPFWVQRFHLSGIKPTRLQIYFFSFARLVGSTQTEAVLYETEDNSTSIQLYLMFGTIKVKKIASHGTCKDVQNYCLMHITQLYCFHFSFTISVNSLDNLFSFFSQVPLAVDPGKDLHLVHSVFPLQPRHSLDSAPITDQLRQLIQQKQLYSLCPADWYSWPAVACGCNTLIVSTNADRPISYLPPLLTHVLLNSLFFLTSSTGVMVVVCPGWEKAQAIFDFLEETKVSHSLHPMIIHVGVKKDEAKSIKIPKNCLLVVTTPFSLVRVLSHHCFLFLRMYHLVLDEVDQLFTLAPEQMTTILQHFQKVVSSEDKTSCPQQIVAVSKQWTSQMEGLITSHMPHPSIIITVPEEAALYANIQQVSHFTYFLTLYSLLLLNILFLLIPINSTLKLCVFYLQAVSNKSAFCMKSHEGLTHEFDFVVQQWRKSIGPGSHVILGSLSLTNDSFSAAGVFCFITVNFTQVTTDECLRCLGIRDATCVIHYGFPSSPRKFGSRLFCMVKNFRNLTEPVHTGCRLSRSVLIVSERNTRHVVGVLRYFGRTSAPLPPELLSFAQGVNVAREDQKTNRPLCSYLKSFGICRDSSVCPDRHSWNSHLDKSELPSSGIIEVVPLFIKTASVFYGRMVSKETNFESIAAEITAFYSDKKQVATEVTEGALYAVQEDDIFHRVKVLTIPDREDRLFFSVFVEFIDIGKRKEVKAHQLMQLPEHFQSVPGQAVEIIVCRVKPSDSEKDWHPKVTRAISQKIKGLQHRARVVLSLGNTIFVDPMIRVSQVPGMKTVINEYNLQSEILKSGMAESNREHINLLKALCQTNTSSNKLSV